MDINRTVDNRIDFALHLPDHLPGYSLSILHDSTHQLKSINYLIKNRVNKVGSVFKTYIGSRLYKATQNDEYQLVMMETVKRRINVIEKHLLSLMNTIMILLI